MDEFLERARPIVLMALEEDIGGGDVTTLATIPAETQARGRFLAKSSGIIAGLDIVGLTYDLVEKELQTPGRDRPSAKDGASGARPSETEGVYGHIPLCRCVEEGTWVDEGTVVAHAAGPAQVLLTAERVALNFVQRMSGIATLTRRFVEAVQGTGAVILDTRKTAPGLRLFDKRAVALGGGSNHRFGLFDMALVKDNHIAAAGGISAAVQGIRDQYQGVEIEVEVADLIQLREALSLGVDRILLDNMTPEQVSESVNVTAGRASLEASGGVNLKNVAAIAASGVDFISVGALTHSVSALDISFDLEMGG